jgi:RHS repeat-associated protein
MRSSWEDRYRAMRTLGVLAVTAACLSQACGTADDVGSTTYAAVELEPIPLLPSEPFGTGPTGVFDVRYDGSAAYTIPLPVPDGRAGMQPSLSLEYNSRSGDGVLGVGWHLGGLSGISRCPSSPATHGRHRGIRFDDGDQLCLDGRPLVRIGGGAHGRDGAMYRPQRNGYERVRLHGNISSPESYFVVEHADGHRSEYGRAPAGRARIMGMRYGTDVAGSPTTPTPSVLSWLLSKRLDSVGNYIEYTYEPGTYSSPGGRESYEVRLIEIRYTGHATLGRGQRTVRFEYEPLYAATEHYVAGFGLSHASQLTRISMFAPGDSVALREYRLAYRESRHTHRPLLDTLTHCDGSQDGCLPPTQFEYSELPESMPDEAQFTEHYEGPTPVGWFETSIDDCYPPLWPQAFMLANIDGAEGDDLVYLEEAETPAGGCLGLHQFRYMTRLSNGVGLGDPASAGILPAPYGFAFSNIHAWPLSAVDTDNDGREEIFDLRSDAPVDVNPPTLHVWEWQDGVLALVESDAFGCAGENLAGFSMLLGDLDGSGVPDLISNCVTTGTSVDWYLRTHGGSEHGVFDAPTLLFSADGASQQGILADYEGDGRLDFISHSAGDVLESARSIDETTGTVLVNATNIPVSDRVLHLDVNGDGLRDVLDLSGDAAAQLRLNTGAGLGAPRDAYVHLPGSIITTEYVGATSAQVRIADFNHDGRDDFALFYRSDFETPAGVYMALHYSNGQSFVVQPHVRVPAQPFSDIREDGSPVYGWGSIQIGDVDGDGAQDFVVADTEQVTLLRNATRTRPDLLSSVRVGPTAAPAEVLKVEYDYAREGREIEDPNSSADLLLYQADLNDAGAGGCAFPQQCVYGGLVVVSRHAELARSNHAGPSLADSIHYEYAYERGRARPDAGAFLGFARRTRTQWTWERVTGDPHVSFRRRDREVTRWDYDLDARAPDGLPAFVGLPIAEERYMVQSIDGRRRASRTEFQRRARTVAGFPPSITFVRTEATTAREYDLVGPVPPSLELSPHYRRVTRTTTFDNYSVPRAWYTRIDGAEGERGRTEIEYVDAVPSHIPAQNRFDRYVSVYKVSQVEDPDYDYSASDEQSVAFVYDPTNGLLSGMTLNGGELSIARSAFHATGVARRIEQRARDPRAAPGAPAELVRSVEVEYDRELLYPTRERRRIGAADHDTLYMYHPGLGILQHVTSPVGAWVKREHDRFGRLRRESHSTGFWATTNYERGFFGADQYKARLTGYDGSLAETWVDVFGRVRETRVHAFNGADEWHTSRETRGLFGEVLERELMHRDGDDAPIASYEYDELIRPTRIVAFDGSESTFSYPDPLAVTHIDPRGNARTTRYDERLRPHSLREPDGATTLYHYGPFGRLRSVDMPGPNEWTYEYDTNGFLAERTDLTTGGSSFAHNAFGELYWMRRGEDDTELHYDTLGRLASRVDADGTSTWTYDCANARGLLCTTMSPDGTEERYTYGTTTADRGRVVRYETGRAAELVRFDYAYDRGRTKSVQIAGPSGGIGSQQLRFTYGPYGHFRDVFSRELGRTVWQALEYHPQGFVSRERFSSGLEVERDLDVLTDRRLELSSEHQDLLVEYDGNFNVSRVIDGHGSDTTYSYDDRDRLEHAGPWTYDYDESGNVLRTETGELAYDAVSTRLTSAFGEAVLTDERGRLEEVAAQHRRYTYTDFDLPRLVEDTESSAEVSLRYTASQSRASSEDSSGATTIYAGGIYERRTEGGVVVRETVRVPGAERIVAEIVSVDRGAPRAYFLHDDHLGSTAAVTSQDRAEVDRAWFAPYGRRTDATGEMISPGSTAHPTRFTGHEVDEWAALTESSRPSSLINMRGREYDPELGRFLSPDPLAGLGAAPDPWNAFAYAGNNPTTFVDPTGFLSGSGSGSGAPLAFDIAPGTANPFELGSPGADWTGGLPPGALHTPNFDDSQQEGGSEFMDIAFAFIDGVMNALNPSEDTPGPIDGHDTAWNVGRVVGAFTGMGVDLFIVGLGFQGVVSSGALELITAGGGTPVAVPVALSGVGAMAAGIALFPSHWNAAGEAIRELRRPQINMNAGGDTSTFRAARPELPRLDSTGKVHGELPRVQDLSRYSPEELADFRAELQQSVRTRIEATVQHGRHRPHGQRQGAEQALIRSIDRMLEHADRAPSTFER